MKILVVGGGGREHTLVWKISKSPMVEKIYCAPGNAGTQTLAQSVPINADDIDALAAFALENEIDLTVVGPEGPLVKGIADVFQEKGLNVFGPSKAAARLEGSKVFSKQHMQKYNIPCAAGKAFTDAGKAKTYAKALGAPCVVKADGLAAGKGVIICSTLDQANEAIDAMINENAFGEAGAVVVVEECLKGEEASFIALTDGKTVLPLPESQDHKRIFDNDEGPNTGGMGAYSPAPVLDHMLRQKAMNEVMIPAVQGMAKEGTPFKGVLYAGLMVDKDQIKVLEFNTRLGDPETQPILMRLKNDLVPLMEACCDGTLHQHSTQIDPRAAMCVVVSSGGYPGSYETGEEILGLDEAGQVQDTVVFHAGTALKEGKVVTAGGRVLGVTSLGQTVKRAIEKAYEACEKISFNNHFYRKDIGAKALQRLSIPPQVGVIMGSDSDFPVMEKALSILKKFDIPYTVTVASAHRTPDRATEFASEAKRKGIKVIICGAGHAAHLAGVIAAHTTLPVLGVPIDSSALQGMDSLLATVQMPPGIPVSTMAIGKPGAYNAGIFAAQILAVSNPLLAEKLSAFKQEMADKVNKKAQSFA
ncbi:phosphoribosylamine--glycine ligase [Desulfobacula toluolica]|uniref:Multifunctional fusion protein n=1 Tax=Desulfobacula toluolica (strain DSM 7467 / Tol2) TaxID=651182 RepID=K0NE88_DESTT|nr:phosphoribosylamine--glycine ligase [Desulfobacula toluolica]CCK79155.1 PurD: phosphoribosylamine--glycine ligase (glycinamide ribonucleotide synthetase) [Desulfobacula toluolica Tol2]